METNQESERIRPALTVNGTDYQLVLERQRGAGIYTNAERSQYLRIGTPEQVAKELGFHKHLLDEGFPVAGILEEGQFEGLSYWVEESLGAEHMSAHFRRDMESSGEISDTTFHLWLRQVMAMRDAQGRSSERRPYDFGALAHFVGEDGMEEELPDLKDSIQAAWEKAKTRTAELPLCLTHGDFTSHNVMERGVIDFGDHFDGPLGYDIVTAITFPFWFPKDQSYEFFQLSNFTMKQIEEFMATCSAVRTSAGSIDLREYFDDLFFLKANWWAVRNHRMPKLQAWRYKRYETVLNLYLSGDSLRKHWLETVTKNED